MAPAPWAKWVTRVSLVVGLVALVVTIQRVGAGILGHYALAIGWFWIAVVVFEVAITLLDALAIRGFAAPDRVPLRLALRAQIAGRSINAVTPGGNLGEVTKVSMLAERMSAGRATKTIIRYNATGFSTELGMVVLAAPLVVAFFPLATSLRWVVIGSGLVSLIALVVIRVLVLRGPQSGGATAAIITSRALSTVLSLLLLHALGQPLSVGFVAVYLIGGFAIYMASLLVPFGLGVAEGGTAALFVALGVDPALGVTLVLARRCVLVVYAAIGLVLVAISVVPQPVVRGPVTKSADSF